MLTVLQHFAFNIQHWYRSQHIKSF